jgi:Zn-dependent protease/predicted transcriptional regulator
MGGGALRLGKIFGIEIGIHFTWLIAFALISWSLAQGFFPAISPGNTVGVYWALGILAAMSLFASVLLHELAHSLVARAHKLNVSSITLFIFGGVSNLQEEPQSARTEFLMAVAGPLTSLIIGGILWAVSLSLGVGGNPFSLFFGSVSRYGPGTAFVYYLGSINILLGIFNLIPGFPLDGGRVLRAGIWRKTGNVVRATNIAATTGQVFGWLFIAYGVYQLLAGAFLGGLWIAFIGWFLNSAAESSRREATLSYQLRGIKVKDVMNPTPECVAPSASVESVVNENFIQHGRRAVPVCRDGALAGIVTLPDVKKLPSEKWRQTEVEVIMTSTPLHTVGKDDDLSVAMKLLAQYGLNQVPVVEGERLIGLLNRADIIGYLQLTQELGMKKKTTE